ncbi:LmeA family phospholipid-binding protein [Cohnella sp. 56]|uniref:LmeA family phospholipid-binding protein n=1 Tax=Cohnella sp. 56 TaxID=3113722 RepID=UPI0030E76CE8
MKKLLIALVALVVLAAAGGFIIYRYVAPARPLDLAYEPVPIENRAVQMLKKMSTELVLSEADVNNLAKASIAANPQYAPDIRITGAEFRLLADNRLAAELNLKVKSRVPVGLSIVYRLEWSEPNLTAVVEQASIRGIDLPADRFDDVVIPLGEELPQGIHIKRVESDASGLRVTFKLPSLRDIQRLIEGL